MDDQTPSGATLDAARFYLDGSASGPFGHGLGQVCSESGLCLGGLGNKGFLHKAVKRCASATCDKGSVWGTNACECFFQPTGIFGHDSSGALVCQTPPAAVGDGMP